ncbi:MAG: hypothetical protein BGP06_04350 [Rhizobiales bacterium 65-9]|nr:MAG: hypothetical protein BGP06_04350 [Rhizobiales bacterium 65-9]
MPLLTDPDSAFIRTERGVAFAMREGSTRQACLVTMEALQDMRTKYHADALETSEEEVFQARRPEIEAIARAKFDRGDLSDDGMVEVRAADIS